PTCPPCTNGGRPFQPVLADTGTPPLSGISKLVDVQVLPGANARLGGVAPVNGGNVQISFSDRAQDGDLRFFGFLPQIKPAAIARVVMRERDLRSVFVFAPCQSH